MDHFCLACKKGHLPVVELLCGLKDIDINKPNKVRLKPVEDDPLGPSPIVGIDPTTSKLWVLPFLIRITQPERCRMGAHRSTLRVITFSCLWWSTCVA